MFIGTPCIIKVGDVKIENLSNTTKKYGMMEVSYKISKNVHGTELCFCNYPDFQFPISSQPNVVELWIFKLLTLLDQMIED